MPVVMLAVGGVFLIRGHLTMGEYVAFSGLIWAIANPMRQMGNIMNEFQRFSAASRKVMELYYSEPKIKDHKDAKPPVSYTHLPTPAYSHRKISASA